MYGFWCTYPYLVGVVRLTLFCVLAIGSMCAPLVCQTVIARGVAWNHFYFGSLVLSALSATLAFFAFRPTSYELELEGVKALNGSCERQPRSVEKLKALPVSVVDEANVTELAGGIHRSQPGHALGRALRLPIVWAFSIFCGLYSGK